MKIAIQGHPTRGREVIRILESLDGINRMNHSGCYTNYFYYISGNDKTIAWTAVRPQHLNVFTLEEFEKEFPFKIGDEVIFPIKIGWASGKVTGLTYREGKLKYEVDNRISGYHYVEPHKLSLYPMKKERNITLTLDKAKEWYKKGGELKEVALQAYSKEELTKSELPKSWEEYCDNYMLNDNEAYFDTCCTIFPADAGCRDSICDKNICPSEKSAEAHLAMIQLEQLRDCYRGLFVTVIGMPVWCIIRHNGRLVISPRTWGMNETFLSFQSPEIAEKYLKNFKSLIEQARDLI